MKNYLTEAKENFVRYMRQRRYSESTIRQYTGYIDKLAETGSRLYRLSNRQIQDFILESNSESSQDGKINALKLFFRLNNPGKRIRVFTRPRKAKQIIEVLTREEVWQIINSISHVKQKAIISGIYLHGLRRSEILNLKYQNIDRERGLLVIRQGKGRKDRLVPLNKEWLKYLAKYARTMKHGKDYDLPIFQPYSASSILAIIKSKAKAVGIRKRVYVHLLRDSFATHLHQQGIDIRYIQEILGHSRVTTTEKYIHLSGKDIANIQLETELSLCA